MNAASGVVQEGTWQITRSSQVEARLQRLQLKIQLASNIAAAHRESSRFAVIGSYDTGNVGDLALGWTIRALSKRTGINASLYSYSSIKAFPRPEKMIVGGGGVFPRHATTIGSLIEQNTDLIGKSSVVSVGVGGRLDQEPLTESFQQFLKKAPFLSTRSCYDRDEITRITDRIDVEVSPDAVFGFANALAIDVGAIERSQSTLGISILPFFLTNISNSICPVTSSPHWAPASHFPELAAQKSQLGHSYIHMIRSLVKVFVQMGWKVRNIPFAVEDDTFARTVLGDLPVTFVRYSGNPVSVFREIARCERVFATRFHAHVFALQSYTPLTSFGYDIKCEELWRELALPENSQVRRDALVNQVEQTVQVLATENGATLNEETCALLGDRAINSVEKAIRATSTR